MKLKKIDYSLYLCTDRQIMSSNTIEESVEEAIKGGVTVVQLREKNCTTMDFLECAKRVKKITQKYEVPLIINDRVDIAVAVNAEGVHVGQDDMDCKKVRKLIGEDKIIGVSVTNYEQAIQAEKDGANYIGVGAIFQSKTKPDAKVVNFNNIKKISDNIKIPIVVIGGINKKSIPLLKEYNISGYAMIRPIIGQENITEASRELLRVINQNKLFFANKNKDDFER